MKIVFDIGGTNMRIAAVQNGTLGEIRKVLTPQDYDETLRVFVVGAKELAAGDVIESAAGCIAAQIDTERGMYDANNRPAWNGRHFNTDLAALLNAPVFVANDCQVIALGELAFGAGKGSRRLAYVTVSTGVGAGLVVDGMIAQTSGFHFGHEIVNGLELEALISGTAVKKKFGIEPKDLASLEERTALADVLARGLVKIISEWQPDTIVIGGSMIVGVNPIPLDRVKETLGTLVAESPALKMAETGDSGGLYGGIVLGAQH